MVFNSYLFILLFMPLVVWGYFLLNKHCNKEKVGLFWLLATSLIFYSYDEWEGLVFIAFSIVFNYLVGQKLVDVKDEDEKAFALRKSILYLGLTGNILALLYFKYSNFILSSIGNLSGKEWEIDVDSPIGISFYTFMQIAFLVDCYRKDKQIDYTFSEYATYVAFFPKVIMGPIALHSEIIPQFRDAARRKVNYINLSVGFYGFTLGLAKKVLIADVLAKFVNSGFNDVEGLNSATALMVMFCYTLQLYFDFSGYCDMAMGVAKMLNIELPMNFNSPYKAKSISEFWDRWHMTLTRFFTRYVYIPLGGSRNGKVRTYINTMLVFLLSGIWHGANWTFIIWGLLHGIFMCLEKMWKVCGIGARSLSGVPGKVMDCFKWIYTFGIINILWVFFRADSVSAAFAFLGRIFSGGWKIREDMIEIFDKLIEVRFIKRLGLEGILEFSPEITIWGILITLVFGTVLLKNTQEKIQENSYNWFRSVIATLLMVWSVISLSNVSEFLYFNF